MTLASPLEPTSLRNVLRHATSDLHVALDRDLSKKIVRASGYVAFLRGSYIAVAGIEEALVQHGVMLSTERATSIEEDLASLGEDTPTFASLVWSPTTLAEAFGSAYVVEGSTLGGVVLARAVEEALGTRATRYLRLRGEGTAQAWRAFLSRLEVWGEGATAVERAGACLGARETFGAFREAFIRAGVIEGFRG